MKKVCTILMLFQLLHPLWCGLPGPFRGFTLTGYSRNAYGNSDDVTCAILNGRYAGRQLVVPVLVTFYVDPKTGAVTLDKDRTPSPEQTICLLREIRSSGNIPALAFYLDPATPPVDRRILTRLDFGQWLKGMERYLIPAAGEGLSPPLIILSSEMTGVESQDWSPLLAGIRKLLPDTSIAYCTYPWSPLLTGGEIPPWIGKLDYFGSTMILSADSGQREELYINAQVTLARIHETARKAGVKPLVGELGFPSHKKALNKAWSGSAPPEEADPALQKEILGELVSLVERSGVSYLFWRLAPAEMEEPDGLTDFGWLCWRKNRDGSVRLTGKPAAEVVDRILIAEPDIYRSGTGEPLSLEGNRILSQRPFGGVKPGGGYDPSRSSSVDYRITPEWVFTFRMDRPYTRLRYRISGFSWSGQIRKYYRGQVVMSVQSDAQSQNNEGYDKIAEIPWEPGEVTGLWDFGELYDFAPLSRITIRIRPSDYGTVIKYLEIILEGGEETAHAGH